MSHESTRFAPILGSRTRKLATALVAGLVLVLFAGCAGGPGRPENLGLPEAASDRAVHIGQLWNGAWIACLVVGVIVWAVMFWCFLAYRRRKTTDVPTQRDDNMGLEITMTAIPLIIVAILFAFTVNTQNQVLARVAEPDQVVTVVGQKWSWTFNYEGDKNPTVAADVWEAGTIEQSPTLVLPVNQSVRFILHSPDVIHSFWVPSFYFKMDVVPGRTNSFDLTPTKEGTFAGKCAELCGTYHSAMLFNVRVVSEPEYLEYLESLKDRGQVSDGPVLGSPGNVMPPKVTAEEGGH